MNLILNLWYCLVEIIKDEEKRYELFVSKNRSLIWICFKNIWNSWKNKELEIIVIYYIRTNSEICSKERL